MKRQYYVYILTNKHKTTLYIGVTNNLKRRVYEHFNGINEGFTKKYKCKYLIYYESFEWILDAIKREKQLKKFNRNKKEAIISKFNPGWKFLNINIGL